MTWFKVDDKLHSHEKVMYLGDEDSDAMALWVIAGSWSADQLTDGWVPQPVARRLDVHFERRAKALVRVGLWDVDVRNGVPGWVFHGWNEPGRQPTREHIEQERTAKSARQQRWREKNRGVGGRFAVDGDVDASTQHLVDGDVDASRDGDVDTAPSRPGPAGLGLPTEVPNTSMHDAQPGLFPVIEAPAPELVPDPMARFAEFYKAYPRHVARGRAEKAWTAAVKLASPGVIIDAARMFAMERKFSDKKLIPYPATWLNDLRWEDEADPEFAPPLPALTVEGASTLPALPAAPQAPHRALNGYAQRPATYDQRAAQADAALASLKARHGIAPNTPAADFGDTFRRI
jgi:hypothetical protein